MRKKDREMDEDFAWDVFDHCMYGVVSGIDDNGKPYGVPVSLSRIHKTVYFHCALAGKKLDMIRHCSNISICCVKSLENKPELLTMNYESCILSGKASMVDTVEEKKDALMAICMRYAPQSNENLVKVVEKGYASTGICRIDVEQISAKRNAKQ